MWNKLFKGKEVYGDWLANVKIEFTGNMTTVPRKLVVKWESKARNELPNEVISSSMRSYIFGLRTDGSQDDLIYCFKGKKSVNEV